MGGSCGFFFFGFVRKLVVDMNGGGGGLALLFLSGRKRRAEKGETEKGKVKERGKRWISSRNDAVSVRVMNLFVFLHRETEAGKEKKR